jgi:hypothetical protein
MSHALFVSMSIKNLDRTVAFFQALGLTFNPKLTDEKAACLLIGEHAYAMLLVESFFKTLTRKQICDTTTHVLVTKAVAAGGTEAGPPEDHGFMYSRSFEDLDGHHWEVVWMNLEAAQ